MHSKGARPVTTAGLFCLIATLTCGTARALGSDRIQDSDPATAFERVSHLDPAWLVHGDSEDVARLADELDVATARSLLAHESPRVRAVALAVLHRQLGPRALPEVLGSIGDDGAAPPARMPLSVVHAGQPLFQEREQTVGELATYIVTQYLQTSGVRWTNGEDGMTRAFAEYWRERRDRETCLGWLVMEMQRASRGTYPTPEPSVRELAALRRTIDALPAPERHWYLLSMASPWSTGVAEPGARDLATYEDLVASARAIGHAALFDLLRGRGPGDEGGAGDGPVSTDPDLRVRYGGALAYERILRFALAHAERIIPTERADELLEIAELHLQRPADGGRATELGGLAHPVATSLWFVAAATLQPERAAEHVAAGFERFADRRHAYEQTERLFLAEAAWLLLGDAGAELAADWFFDERPARGAVGFGRHAFASALARPERSQLLWRLAGDTRTSQLDTMTLQEMARATNAHLPDAPPFTERELLDAHHPLGLAHVDAERDRAEALHPDATRALDQLLEEWRRRLRDLAREHG